MLVELLLTAAIEALIKIVGTTSRFYSQLVDLLTTFLYSCAAQFTVFSVAASSIRNIDTAERLNRIPASEGMQMSLFYHAQTC